MISQLGKYEIRRELGRGAMGVVYEAYDPLIKRHVALKTIRPDQLGGENADDVIARFRREAQAAGRLSHPNIVSIYDFAEENGTWFIAMEFVNGRELKECFAADERFRPADIERIMLQILDALDYSHRQGVVHRDIKPANIFLLDDGNVKVADFGIAHIESSNLTQVGTVMGTPNYMSPEQIMGLPIDGRSDLFSAGVILYQFLTGERPFAGSSTTTMQKVLKEDPLPPSTLNVQLPGAMDAVVRKALAKRADDRFQTAREFADALRAAGQIKPAAARAAALSAAPDPDATMRNDAPAPTTAGGAPAARPSRMTAIAIIAALAVIGIGVIAAAWWRGSHDANTASASAADPVASQAATTAQAPAAASDAAPQISAAIAAAPAANPGTAAPAATSAVVPSGSLLISAVGIVDPSDPRYAGDKALLQADVRADSKSQLVEKVLVLLLDRNSFTSHYDLLQSRLMANSGPFIDTIVRETEPRIGRNGLMSITTQAVVNVKAVQQSLNQMSRDERVQLIRANGDPRVSLRISVRDADQPDAPAQPSPIAENVLKERIRSFGFRTWSDDATAGSQVADFAVTGEAALKKLSTRLAASGLVITKYALSSWTIKCTDRLTGEEIYFNTTLPKGGGSSASEEEALRAIGTQVADQFTRELFLQHVHPTGRKVTFVVTGMPDATSEELLAHELLGLPSVLGAAPRAPAEPRVYDLLMGGASAVGDALAADVIGPLNAKLGQACFALGAIDGAQVSVAFDPRCAEGLARARLETGAPAALYGAPPARQKAVIRNPDALRKLMV